MAEHMYPEWMQRWNHKAAEIDAKIIAWFKQAGAEFEELWEELRIQLKQWAVDAAENTEKYEREHKDMKDMRAKLESRVDELEREGKIERQRDNLLHKQ
jgi:hypothetical protein